MSHVAPSVRASSIRVALAATAFVGAAYLAVAIVILAIVSTGLTRQVDDRLTGSLSRMTNGPAPQDGRPFEAPRPERPFGPTLLVWTVAQDGTITANTTGAELPATDADVTEPRTIDLSGTSVRIAGADIPTAFGISGARIVVGQTLDAVSQAQWTIVLAELVIAPVLLIVVFLGAVAIGRRVAAPIERARQRQMEFTADASHELRTPLSVIEAQTSLALAHERSPDWYRTAFGRIERESGRMRRLVEDMLWLARFDAAGQPPTSEPVDLGVLASGAADRFAILAEARHQHLAVSVAPGDHVVAAPPDWLDRLLGVLLDNACRYAPEGGNVRVLVRSVDGRTAVIVEDDGPGIPVEERARVFDRFHRATDTAGGSGLGLAIADAIVRASGGRWRIDDAPGGGASMAVSWPRALSREG